MTDLGWRMTFGALILILIAFIVVTWVWTNPKYTDIIMAHTIFAGFGIALSLPRVLRPRHKDQIETLEEELKELEH